MSLLLSLRKCLADGLKESEKTLMQHISVQCQELKASVNENKQLIAKAAKNAYDALNLANTNSNRIDELAEKIEKLETDKVDLIEKNATQSIQITVLQRRLEDQTSRFARNSLIFRGVPEDVEEKSWEETRTKICDTFDR